MKEYTRFKRVFYSVYKYSGEAVKGSSIYSDVQQARRDASDAFMTGNYDYVFVWGCYEYFPEDDRGVSVNRVEYSFIKKPLLLLLSDGRYIIDTPDALQSDISGDVVKAIDVQTLSTVYERENPTK